MRTRISWNVSGDVDPFPPSPRTMPRCRQPRYTGPHPTRRRGILFRSNHHDDPTRYHPGSAGYRSLRYDWYVFLFSTAACVFWLVVGVMIGRYLL